MGEKFWTKSHVAIVPIPTQSCKGEEEFRAVN
jgi:hypothetical protein